MKYEPILVTSEIVNKFKDYYSISYREALEVAHKQNKRENKKLLLKCLEQAKSIEDVKEILISIVNII